MDGEDIAGKDVADICRDVGYLPQDPNTLLFADTVLDELMITLRNHGLIRSRAAIRPSSRGRCCDELGLAHKASAYPRDLSVGERQRVALAAITVTEPRRCCWTSRPVVSTTAPRSIGADTAGTWRDQGMAIGVVTHDVELAAPPRRPRRADEPGRDHRPGAHRRGDGRVATLCAADCAALSGDGMVDN